MITESVSATDLAARSRVAPRRAAVRLDSAQDQLLALDKLASLFNGTADVAERLRGLRTLFEACFNEAGTADQQRAAFLVADCLGAMADRLDGYEQCAAVAIASARAGLTQ